MSKTVTNGSLGNWNANIFHVNRRKWIFMINERSCYSIIIPDFRKSDLKKFNEIFTNRLMQQLCYDGVKMNRDAVQKIRDEQFSFTNTNNNRPIIGTMTQFIKDLNYFIFYHPQQMSLPELNNKLTNNWVTALAKNKQGMHNPVELITRQLTE